MAFHLARLHALNFRNHREAEVELCAEVNCFTGPNGVGKTNLLDAVHYLAIGKGYLEPQDQHNIHADEAGFVLQGVMHGDEGDDVILCSVRRGERKVLSRNRKEYDRLADHVGRYPVVMITPYDGQLVLDGSEARRRFIDGLIAQFDKPFLETLIRYNRALAQRNVLLKQMQAARSGSMAALAPWDEQLCALGSSIHRARASFIEEMAPLLTEHYNAISSGQERVALTHRSALNDTPMADLLADAWERDRAAGHTTMGVHKDDLLFQLEGEPLKRFGSQGQQKTYLIALKLAQFEITARRSGQKPLLLLDDIFDKIDPQRMRHLLRLLSDHRFGQVLITDTDPLRLHAALDGLDLETRFFAITHKGITREAPQRAIAG